MNTYRVINLYFLSLQCNDSSMLYCSIWRLWSYKHRSDTFISPGKENKLWRQLQVLKHEALMVNVLDSRSSAPSLSPGQDYGVFLLDKTLPSHSSHNTSFLPGLYYRLGVNLCGGVTLASTLDRSRITPSLLML